MRALLPFLLTAVLLGQQPGFRTQTRLVLVPAVIEGDLANLDADRFTVLDNGVPQLFTMDTFGTGVAPIALVVAVQNSGLSAGALAKVKKIGAMIQPLILGERGCAALVTFSETVRWDQECTQNATRLTQAFQQITTGAGRSGRLLDAVEQAIAQLAARPASRRVILLISESRDRGSAATLDSVLPAAQDAGVAIYSATYSAFRSTLLSKPEEVLPKRKRTDPQNPALDKNERFASGGAMKVLHPNEGQKADLGAALGELVRLGQTKTTEALARATGATEYSFTKLNGLEKAIEQLGEELHGQYIFSFTPKDPIPGYHALTIQIKDGANFKIRARPGYWVN
jgi:VWFA-related protein